MRTDHSTDTIDDGQAEFDSLWGLDAPLRFPVGVTGWESFDPFHLLEVSPRAGSACTYREIVGPRSIPEDLDAMLRLMASFPADFQALQALSPEAWRLLYYRHCYVADSLASRRFSADSNLRAICERIDVHDDPPLPWIGSLRPTTYVAEEMGYTLRCVGVDPARAAWTILSMAHRLDLSKSEVLHCQWWNPVWIQALASKLSPGMQL